LRGHAHPVSKTDPAATRHTRQLAIKNFLFSLVLFFFWRLLSFLLSFVLSFVRSFFYRRGLNNAKKQKPKKRKPKNKNTKSKKTKPRPGPHRGLVDFLPRHPGGEQLLRPA
jgi:hypothetical protein